jgi:hypothetical protein
MSRATERYNKHRRWALQLAGDDDDDKIVALVALWDAAQNYSDAERGFRAYTELRICEKLAQPKGDQT